MLAKSNPLACSSPRESTTNRSRRFNAAILTQFLKSDLTQADRLGFASHISFEALLRPTAAPLTSLKSAAAWAP